MKVVGKVIIIAVVLALAAFMTAATYTLKNHKANSRPNIALEKPKIRPKIKTQRSEFKEILASIKQQASMAINAKTAPTTTPEKNKKTNVKYRAKIQKVSQTATGKKYSLDKQNFIEISDDNGDEQDELIFDKNAPELKIAAERAKLGQADMVLRSIKLAQNKFYGTSKVYTDNFQQLDGIDKAFSCVYFIQNNLGTCCKGDVYTYCLGFGDDGILNLSALRFEGEDNYWELSSSMTTDKIACKIKSNACPITCNQAGYR
ncbi:MAG: hypothetical protein LBM71_03545 [Elusimicrobiota bacterium]|jgi:hypothetical protein|nr:hypothetical protein [Elusimicrobiota bacterium]